jgi:CheY-like chemotaxis protein
MGDTARAGAGTRSAVGPPAGPLVLVVDDHEDTRAICQRALEMAGYRVVTAASGDEALARLEEHRPAVVVLDLAMPGMDGFTTAHLIRSRPTGARTPILIFTGLPPKVEDSARRAGGTAFCLKPIEPRRFVAEVKRLCPLS